MSHNQLPIYTVNKLFLFCNTEGAIQSCNATAYVISAALSPGALIALLVCMLILIGKQMDALMYAFTGVTRR